MKKETIIKMLVDDEDFNELLKKTNKSNAFISIEKNGENASVKIKGQNLDLLIALASLEEKVLTSISAPREIYEAIKIILKEKNMY